MKTIYLVRHGEYDYKDISTEVEGQGLTVDGIKQAKATAGWFKKLGKDVTSIYSSDYLRAKQTAEIISFNLKGLTVEVSRELRECRDIYYKELPNTSHVTERAFHRHFGHHLDDGEYFDIIVCHANLIRYFLSRIQDWSQQEWQKRAIPNCSITKILMQGDGQFVVPFIARDDHLPVNLRENIDEFT